MAQESTAINDLIHRGWGKRIELDDEPAADLFSSPPPPKAVSLRPAPAPLPAMHAQQYRIPTTVARDDEETEMWNTAAHDTAPAVPKILPNVATVVAQPQVAAIPRAPQQLPSFLRGPIQPPAQPVPTASSRTGLPAVAPAPAPGFHASSRTRSSTIAPAAPAPYLVARELASSAFRSWGGIVALGVLALGVGVYLAIASARRETTPQPPSDRERAVAIMNGTAQPEPPSVKAPPPVVVIAPTAEPIIAEQQQQQPPPAPPIAAPTATPIEVTPVAQPAEAVEAVAEISVDDIELEPAAARPAKRAARSSRKRVAVASTTRDPVQTILDRKPTKPDPRPTKKLADKKLVATEIAAPRGAAATTGTGKVTITSDRPAMVFLDGRPTGKQAPTALVIPAGDHQITLLDPETKKAKTATIQLAANKSIAISKTFN